jgi:hypothetical protein
MKEQPTMPPAFDDFDRGDVVGLDEQGRFINLTLRNNYNPKTKQSGIRTVRIDENGAYLIIGRIQIVTAELKALMDKANLLIVEGTNDAGSATKED